MNYLISTRLDLTQHKSGRRCLNESVGIECEEITSAEPPINVNLPVLPPVNWSIGHLWRMHGLV